MKSIIYQLLSKGLMLVVLLTVVAGYYYRVELFPKWFAEEETGEQLPAPVVEPGAAGNSTLAVSDAAVNEASPQLQPAAASSTQTETPPAPVFRPLTEPVKTSEHEETTGPADTTEPVDTAAQPVPVVTEDPPPADIASARKAYWARDLDGAIAAYKAVLAAEPANADAHGELGNVYFAQGKTELASKSYLLAAEHLLAQGKEQAAARLMPVLVRLSPQYAAQLARELADTANQSGRR